MDPQPLTRSDKRVRALSLGLLGFVMLALVGMEMTFTTNVVSEMVSSRFLGEPSPEPNGRSVGEPTQSDSGIVFAAPPTTSFEPDNASSQGGSDFAPGSSSTSTFNVPSPSSSVAESEGTSSTSQSSASPEAERATATVERLGRITAPTVSSTSPSTTVPRSSSSTTADQRPSTTNAPPTTQARNTTTQARNTTTQAPARPTTTTEQQRVASAPNAAGGTTYYVSPNGSGVSTNINNPGAVQATIESVCNGAGNQIGGGDTIIFRNGTYDIIGLISPSPTVTKEAISLERKTCMNASTGYLTLQSEARLGAKIDVSRPSQNKKGFNIEESQYVIIDGFEIAGGRDYRFESGVELANSNHIIVRNNRMHDFGAGGITAHNWSFGGANNGSIPNTHYWIEGNEVFRTGYLHPGCSSGISLFRMADPQGFGTSINGQSNYSNVILNNRVYNNDSDPNCGFAPHGQTDGNCFILDYNKTYNYTDPTLVAGNECFNNGGAGLHVYQSGNVDVINNTTYSNNRVLNDGGELSSACTNDQGTSANIRFINNLAVGRNGRHNVTSFHYGTHCFTGNVTYHNNIIADDTNGSFGVDAPGVFNTTRNPARLGTCGSDNLLTPTASFGFTNPGTAGSSDFSLRANSIAIDNGCAGALPSWVTRDIAGNPRVSGASIDVGAHEFRR